MCKAIVTASKCAFFFLGTTNLTLPKSFEFSQTLCFQLRLYPVFKAKAAFRLNSNSELPHITMSLLFSYFVLTIYICNDEASYFFIFLWSHLSATPTKQEAAFS